MSEREELMTKLVELKTNYKPMRKVVQIAVGGPNNGSIAGWALCNDGSIFKLLGGDGDLEWKRLPDIPQMR